MPGQGANAKESRRALPRQQTVVPARERRVAGARYPGLLLLVRGVRVAASWDSRWAVRRRHLAPFPLAEQNQD